MDQEGIIDHNLIMDGFIIQNQLINEIKRTLKFENVILDSLVVLALTSAMGYIYSNLDNIKKFLKNLFAKKMGPECSSGKIKYKTEKIEKMAVRVPYINFVTCQAILRFVNEIGYKPQQHNMITPVTENCSNLDDLKKNRLVLIPTGRTKLCPPYSDISIIYDLNEGQDKNETSITVYADSNVGRIDEFVNAAFVDYYEYNYLTTDQYILYMEVRHNIASFRPFRFTSSTTFDDLFFDQKEELTNFIKNKNFAKCNILLHGPPGTGKTSVIKAIANMTKRSLIYVKLSEVSSFDQLNEICFGERYYANGTQKLMNIPVDHKMIILEDIDAENDILQKREEKEIEKPNKKKSPNLNLSDVLQIFSGINEYPGSMIIVTTNHIETFDAAFTRDERFTHKIYLGHMSRSNCLALIRHRFEGALDRFNFIQDNMFTPATITALLNKSAGIDDFHNRLVKIIPSNNLYVDD